VPATLLVSVLVASLPASASQNGRPGFSGNPAINGGATCTVCHAPTGAALPAVSLNGPTVLDAATSFDFTVTLSGGPAVTGGVNISVVDTNGVPIGALQPLDGDLQVAGDELTHTAPKSFVGDEVTFSFRFIAPDYDVEGSIYVAGNASNGALNLIGDGVDAGSWPITIENGFAPPPPPPPPPSNPELSADVFATGLTLPVAIANAGDERLFVVEQPGRIRIVDPDGSMRSAPFLDIEARVDDTNGEMGLLGLSFHPDYANNGYFYVYYTRDPGPGLDRTRVSRFTVSADPDLGDPASELVLLEFEQPYSNHNGGDLHFGPDGYLYIASGDGGSGGDPQDNAQDPDRLLGKLLRIDVDTSAGNGPDCDVSGAGNYFIPAGNAYNDGPGGVGCDEVYALGLRNPWRFSFDPTTGDIWIGDVGQNNKEEINRIPAGSAGGLNLGWRCYEGNQPYNLDGCDGAYLFPVYDFSHGNGSCSVTGGVVYRGAEYPELDGEYIFSDFCNTSVRALAGPLGAPVVREVLPANVVAAPSAFGTDTGGEIYVASLYSGILYRLRSADSDGDGLADDVEITMGTDPSAVDSDGDGLVDGDDGVIPIGAYPAGVDANGDGYVDGERTLGTDPTLTDSDGDQLDDGLEVARGTDPLDPDDWPKLADGDLAPWDNPDGQINAGDVLIATQLVVGQRTSGPLQYAHGDMNVDGVINLADLLLIQKVVLP
jgi:glucose/arabinose dehydrogenase